MFLYPPKREKLNGVRHIPKRMWTKMIGHRFVRSLTLAGSEIRCIDEGIETHVLNDRVGLTGAI
jgi:hypothetical protein